MNEVSIDKHTGLANPPVFPCYKDEVRLCSLKFAKNGKMECTFEARKCFYAWKSESKTDKPVQKGLI